MSCYRRDCLQVARHRITQLHEGWRAWLRLPPRTWHVCDAHRFDPVSRRHADRLHRA